VVPIGRPGIGTRVTALRLEPALAGVGTRLGRTAARVKSVRPAYIVGGFVVVQWLTTLALARTVRHNGWLYYHGGDQVWFYTTSWLLRHGLLPPTSVGFGWSVLLMPFTFFSGPNLISALPAIVLLNVLFLMPVAIVAMYGIGERLGGRLFGYWVLFLWIVLPFIGIKYTNAGFKQRYTEISLPASFGLTSMSDFPHMVMLTVGAYFLVRAIQGRLRYDALFAGLFTGAAIGIKPSSALFLAGATLALAGCRCWRMIPPYALGVLPSIAALTYWKWRGLGYLPLFHAEHVARLALAATAAPIGAAFGTSKYLPFDWHQFSRNLDSVQEHFWSKRVLEWIVLAGSLALLRRSRLAFLLFAGWFWTFVLVKGASTVGSLETGALLRLLIPAIPPFVLLVACLPLLLPRLPRRLPHVPLPREWGSRRLRLTLGIACVLLFAVVPVALAASAKRTVHFAVTQSGPIPMVNSLHVHLRLSHGVVRLTWKRQKSSVPVFYEVVRAKMPTCSGEPFLTYCATIFGTPRTPPFDDSPSSGTYEYWVLLGANWQDYPAGGEEYLASPPALITIP
jgi:hypothetical protein